MNITINNKTDLDKHVNGRYFRDANITSIQFGNKFNEDITHLKFPLTLKNLKFGNTFNQYLNEYMFNHYNDGKCKLDTLEFGRDYNKIYLHKSYIADSNDQLSVNLEFLNNGNHIPIPARYDFVKKIIFGDNFNQQFYIGNVIEKVILNKEYNQLLPKFFYIYPDQTRIVDIYFPELYTKSLLKFDTRYSSIFPEYRKYIKFHMHKSYKNILDNDSNMVIFYHHNPNAICFEE
jgi:hypothetical protein